MLFLHQLRLSVCKDLWPLFWIFVRTYESCFESWPLFEIYHAKGTWEGVGRNSTHMSRCTSSCTHISRCTYAVAVRINLWRNRYLEVCREGGGSVLILSRRTNSCTYIFRCIYAVAVFIYLGARHRYLEGCGEGGETVLLEKEGPTISSSGQQVSTT